MKACCPKADCACYARGWGHKKCIKCNYRAGGPHTSDEHEDNYSPRRSR